MNMTDLLKALGLSIPSLQRNSKGQMNVKVELAPSDRYAEFLLPDGRSVALHKVRIGHYIGLDMRMDPVMLMIHIVSRTVTLDGCSMSPEWWANFPAELFEFISKRMEH
jgi:hypothetical protein